MPMTIDRRRLLAGTAAMAVVASAPARRATAQEPRAKLRIGIVPLISSGPIFLAQAKGFFEKVNLDVEIKYFADGVLAMPSLVAGEIDVTVATLNAGLFNTVSKGAPFKLILDRGSEKPGSGSMTIAASNAMVQAGMTAPNKMAHAQGQDASPSRRRAASISICLASACSGRASIRAPMSNGRAGLPIPTSSRLMGAGQADAANIPVPLGFLVEKNNFGKLVFSGYDIEPNMPARLLGDVVGVSGREPLRRRALRDGAHSCRPALQQGGRGQGPRGHQDHLRGDQGAAAADRGRGAALDVVLRGRHAEHRLLHGAGQVLDRIR